MLAAELDQVSAGAAACAEAGVWVLSDADLLASLDAVHAATVQLVAATAHLARGADARGLPAAAGATSLATWLRERLRVDVGEARRLAALATSLDRSPALDAAVCAAVVNPAQAAVIDAAVRALPVEVGAQVAGEAEAVLIEQAEVFEPVALRRLGERILTHVAPEVAERAEAEALERQAERARTQRALHLSDVGDGRVRLTGWLDREGAATVNAALDPLCKPTSNDTRSPAQRRADALVEVCGLALGVGELPDNGGERPHLVVTLPFDWLRDGAGAATLDTGESLTAEQVRRMACDARLIPVVLDGDGQPLDLGRSRRLVGGALRRALVLRDRGCGFPGCDRPPRWCAAHHVVPWQDGGPTSLANTVLTCGFHHRVIHRGDWEVRIATDGYPEFIPPTHIDPRRRPRRNHRHHHHDRQGQHDQPCG